MEKQRDNGWSPLRCYKRRDCHSERHAWFLMLVSTRRNTTTVTLAIISYGTNCPVKDYSRSRYRKLQCPISQTVPAVDRCSGSWVSHKADSMPCSLHGRPRNMAARLLPSAGPAALVLRAHPASRSISPTCPVLGDHQSQVRLETQRHTESRDGLALSKMLPSIHVRCTLLPNVACCA
ncbi:hypothetical protein IG631_11222 [Alternaria alternata]|nr:hypothetical protein IG631_11222 [Alternaria alternata]